MAPELAAEMGGDCEQLACLEGLMRLLPLDRLLPRDRLDLWDRLLLRLFLEEDRE